MPHYAALDVSQETTAICIVDENGRVAAERKVPTCPEAIGTWLDKVWGMRLAKAAGFKKARVAVARKLAVVLHAMGKTNTAFRWSQVTA